MSPLAHTGLIFGLMLLLMALRTPIAVSMFVAGSIGYIHRRSRGSRATTCR
jgi:C4-dicarboxylate transporter DctM subunit